MSIEEKIKKIGRLLHSLHYIIDVLIIIWLITLAGFIGKVVHYHNFVEGWDLSKDPVDLWIGLGIVALLWERAFDRMWKKEKRDGTSTS